MAVGLLLSSLPAWILCTMVAKLRTLPLLASVVPGLWHITQNCVSTRPPPCKASLPWQPLQDATSVILRVLVGSVTGTDLPLASIVKSKYGLTSTVTPA